MCFAPSTLRASIAPLQYNFGLFEIFLGTCIFCETTAEHRSMRDNNSFAYFSFPLLLGCDVLLCCCSLKHQYSVERCSFLRYNVIIVSCYQTTACFAKVHNPVYMFLRRLSSLIGLASFDGWASAFFCTSKPLGVQSYIIFNERSELINFCMLQFSGGLKFLSFSAFQV